MPFFGILTIVSSCRLGAFKWRLRLISICYSHIAAHSHRTVSAECWRWDRFIPDFWQNTVLGSSKEYYCRQCWKTQRINHLTLDRSCFKVFFYVLLDHNSFYLYGSKSKYSPKCDNCSESYWFFFFQSLREVPNSKDLHSHSAETSGSSAEILSMLPALCHLRISMDEVILLLFGRPVLIYAVVMLLWWRAIS